MKTWSPACLLLVSVCLQAQTFVHPGLLVTDNRLTEIQAQIQDTDPCIQSVYSELCAHAYSCDTFFMSGPYETVARDGVYAFSKSGSERDMEAAFQQALLYRLGHGEKYAQNAKNVVNAYARVLQRLDGHDAPLCALQCFYLVNAAELLRNEMTTQEIAAFREMMQRVFLPMIRNFDAQSPYANGNWGAIVNKLRMAMAIYADNRNLYDEARNYYLHAYDNGSLPYYISSTGQCQETGRDQGHAQLGIGALAEVCEMAWNQGDDLYGALDNRLLAGYEYTAKYNLGYDVPFETWTDVTGLYGSWTTPGAMSRGKFWDIYELAYNHYVGRKHLSMPYTAIAVGRTRPEQGKDSDYMRWGTLLFYRGTKADTSTHTPKIKEEKKLHQVFTYPAPEGAPLKKDYEVWVQPRGGEWQRVDTYSARVNVGVGDNKHRVSALSYGVFDFQGDVFVKVISKKRKFRSVRIRPDYKGVIANVRNDSVVQFMLFQPENISVEFDGDITENLLLFTGKPIVPMSRERKRKYIEFLPGYYHPEGDTLRIPSHCDVYISGGAYVDGTILIGDAEDVRVYGRGIVRPNRSAAGIAVERSRNVTINGLTVTQLPTGESDGVTIRDCRSITHYGWGDGMNVFASSNVLFDRVFCRNSDDCTTVYATRKGFRGSSRNITMQNSTLWADVAHPIFIGIHGNSAVGDSCVDLTFRNIDILGQSEPQLDYQGCMSINCGDNNRISRVFFQNIRIENIQQGSILQLRVCYNFKYCSAPGQGISDVEFRNIRYTGNVPELSIISGYDGSRKVSNIRFSDFRINGKVISDDMPGKPGWYKTADMGRIFVGEHVDGVSFSK